MNPFTASAELQACTPTPLDRKRLNLKGALPYGCTPQHIYAAMQEWLDFLGFINVALNGRNLPRLESFLMAANFSSIVSEFMKASIPKHCPTLVANTYHNGHPDLIPAGMFPDDAAQHSDKGIEVKASRYGKSWQGHNAEDTWLLVFAFSANRQTDRVKGIKPMPFAFGRVAGAAITKADWQFAGRSETSRRTITATVKPSGFAKMMANWIYVDQRVRLS